MEEQLSPGPKTVNQKIAAFFKAYWSAGLSVLLFVVALGALHYGLDQVELREVVREIRSQPAGRLAGALALTFASYVLLTLYDYIGLFYIDRRLPYSQVALAAFVGYAFSNSIGHALLVGTPVRFRLYAASGLSAFDVGKLMVYATTMIWVGFVAVSGLIFTIEPVALPASLPGPFSSTWPIGVVFIGLTLAFSWLSWFAKKPLVFRGHSIEMPKPRLAFPQMVAAGADWVMAGSVLYLLTPESLGVGWLAFVGITLLAQLVGYVSQVPGGLGVFETTILVLAAPQNPAALVGALVLYRLIYYLLPLALGVGLLLAREIAERREKISHYGRVAGRLLPAMAPPALAIAALAGGTVLLFSVALPTPPFRLEVLRGTVPLALVEAAHFLAALSGVGLVLVAPALDRRLDAAWRWTAALLGTGAAACLVKGYDFEEAFLLGFFLLALLPARRHFPRHLALRDQPYSPSWIVALAVVLTSAIWLGFFAHKAVDYVPALWWTFAYEAEASRCLRAVVGVLTLVALFALAHLRPPAGSPPAAE